ncbi:MAG: serine protease [Puniceicoccaceae bacterium]
MRFRFLVTLLLLAPAVIRGDWTAQIVEDTTTAPHSYTGVLEAEYWLGTGVVVSSQYTAVTAAHVLYDEAQKTWLNSIEWRIRNENTPVIIRGMRYSTSYASAQNAHGSNADQTFTEDFAALYSYEALSGGDFAEVVQDPFQHLTGNEQKLIIGFPAGLYDLSDPRAGQMHQSGPFTSGFSNYHVDFYYLEGVSCGPGASGGGLWVKVDDHWKIAGVYVAGLETSLGDSENSAGVVALTDSKMDLLNQALAQVGLGPYPIITLQPSPTIHKNWDEETVLTVEFSSSSAIEHAWWEYEKLLDNELRFISVPSHPPDEVPEIVNTATSSTIRIPPNTPYYNNKRLRMWVRNADGKTTSSPFRIVYTEPDPIIITRHPQSLELSDNADAVFNVELEANTGPPLAFNWEYKPKGQSDYHELYIPDPKTSTISLPANKGYYDQHSFRVNVTNGWETVTSHPATLNYTDLGATEFDTLLPPPQLITWGSSAQIGFEFSSTMEYSITWNIWDAIGNSFNSNALPAGWELSQDSERLTIDNSIASAHGFSVQATLAGKYYNPDEDGSQFIQVSFSSPLWTLNAQGPARVSPLKWAYSPDHSYHELEVNWIAQNEPDIEWQISTDGGSRWHPYSDSNLNFLQFGMDNKFQNSASIRAKLSTPGFNPVVSGSVELLGPGQIVISKDDVDTRIQAEWMSNIAIHEDFLIACATRTVSGNAPVRVYERIGTSWQDMGSITIDGVNSDGAKHLMFINDKHLLVSAYEYRHSPNDRNGGIAEIKKDPDGVWRMKGFLTAQHVIDEKRGDFGYYFDYHNGILVVAEPRSPTPFHTFSLMDGNWIPAPPVDMTGATPGYYSGWKVDISGDTVLYGPATLFEKTEQGGFRFKTTLEGINNSNPVFLDEDSCLTYHNISSTSKLGQFESWAPIESGSYAKVDLPPVTLGRSIRLTKPNLANSFGNFHSIVVGFSANDFPFWQTVLFETDVPNASVKATTISALDPFRGYYVALSSSTMALGVFNVDDDIPGESPWQIWMIPLDQIHLEPLAGRLPPLQLKSRLEQQPGAGTSAILQFRESVSPSHPTTIQSSTDGDSWNSMGSGSIQRTVLQSDVDGDGKTSLIQATIPVESDTDMRFFRVVED